MASKKKNLKEEEYWISDGILECVFEYLDHPSDRNAVSLVCKQWHRVDAFTRKSVTVLFIYSAPPTHLTRRFTNLEGLRIKGKPRISEFGLTAENWGGYAYPWIEALVDSKRRMGAYHKLSSLHFRRMEISDDCLHLLADEFSNSLQILKLDKCSGLSTAGLHAITRSCRYLRILYLEESCIDDMGSDWLRELAMNNSVLEVLNFTLTGLEVEDVAYVAAIVERCKSLKSLKLGEINADAANMRGILKAAPFLSELAVSYCTVVDEIDNNININSHYFELPSTLTSFAGDIPYPLHDSIATGLTELDLMSTSTTLTAEAHIEVIKSCVNLQVLKVRNLIGDAGLKILGSCCKNLKSIRLENLEDVHGYVSHEGLISLACNCIHLRYVAMYVSDITNAALEAFGNHCRNLTDFRVVLLGSEVTESRGTELSLDRGVKGLLKGCGKLRRLALYFRYGGLTDEGLGYIGELGGNLEWILMGFCGESDDGLLKMASGCHSLLKLEVRDCPFSEVGIVGCVRKMKALRYMWFQGYIEMCGEELMGIGSFWNIEYTPACNELSAQIIGYRSLSGPRLDAPPQVFTLL